MTAIARHVRVSGRVQGVAFRWHTREEALRLGLAGWVRNLPDGTVEVWAEGEPEAVAALERWLERGPALARVTGTEGEAAEPRGLAGFEVRRGTGPA